MYQIPLPCSLVDAQCIYLPLPFLLKWRALESMCAQAQWDSEDQTLPCTGKITVVFCHHTHDRCTLTIRVNVPIQTLEFTCFTDHDFRHSWKVPPSPNGPWTSKLVLGFSSKARGCRSGSLRQKYIMKMTPPHKKKKEQAGKPSMFVEMSAFVMPFQFEKLVIRRASKPSSSNWISEFHQFGQRTA